MAGMQREPCFWLTTSDPNNGEAERSRTRMVAGRKVTERFPQHGHEGDYENRRKARGRRYIMIVRHEGHVVPLLLTNAAAHLTHGPYAQYQLSKARHYGWYPAGACPCALHIARELTRDQVVSDDVKNGTPCAEGTYSLAQPCPHDLAERKARADMWAIDQAERLSKFRDTNEQLVDAQRQLNKELVVEVANVVADRVSGTRKSKAE